MSRGRKTTLSLVCATCGKSVWPECGHEAPEFEADYCVDCGVDYDAMTPEERARHTCHGEIVVLTCRGNANDHKEES